MFPAFDFLCPQKFVRTCQLTAEQDFQYFNAASSPQLMAAEIGMLSCRAL